MIKRLTMATVLVLMLVLNAPHAAEATDSTSALDQCVVHVTGQKTSGELELGPPRCYGSRAEAMSAENVGEWGPGAAERAAVTATSFTIGYHCDGYNLAAPCTSVVGDGCTGGWLNTSAAWDNRISSTQNGCPTIRHFDGTGLTGSWVATTGVGSLSNLTTFNNRTTSIQYL